MKRKFNFFDVIIILLILAAAFIGYKMLNKTTEQAVSKVSEITFTVEINNCENDLAEKIKEGDMIYDSIKGGYYGEVIKVEHKPATNIVADSQNGEFKKVEYNDAGGKRDNVYITIKGTPTSMNDEHIMFASQKVKIGEFAYLKASGYVAFGYVIDIDVLE